MADRLTQAERSLLRTRAQGDKIPRLLNDLDAAESELAKKDAAIGRMRVALTDAILYLRIFAEADAEYRQSVQAVIAEACAARGAR